MSLKLIVFAVSFILFQGIQARCYFDSDLNYVCIDENWWERQSNGARAGVGLGVIFVIIIPCILCCYCCCGETQHTTVVMGRQPSAARTTMVVNNTNMMQQQPYARQVNYPV